MNAVIYKFPTLKTKLKHKELCVEDVEKYTEIFENRSKYQNLKNIIETSMSIDRLFKGSYNTFGIIPEKHYKKLLSFYNSQSKENWLIVKDIRIVENLTVEDIYKYSDTYIEGSFPTIDILINLFNHIRNKKELEIFSKFDYYDNLTTEMEEKYSELSTLFRH